MRFSRQEYWSRLPYPTPVDLPNPGIKPASVAAPALSGRLLTAELPGKPQVRFVLKSSGPITSWQVEGEKVEIVTDFILGGSKITADTDSTINLKDAFSLEGTL